MEIRPCSSAITLATLLFAAKKRLIYQGGEAVFLMELPEWDGVNWEHIFILRETNEP
ncbi:hypothetical protein GCM10008018_43140 [Paenibacillus marchantiophytorum]|uniref:Uncharacterized protein n=1 Tax=Paenibacillus marchantiophytorum TaxID=1619310 RepID=A0ABQ1EYU8_9BACL|nr:hypothetical protein GCM10008018_43140 [Paenibacillus marchantiophytorum]